MLLQSELERLKYESGFNLLTLSALPYALDGVTQIFEQVVQPYLQAGVLTYSSTPVAAIPVGGSPSPVTLTVVSTAGIAVGDRLIVDQDLPQEGTHVSAIGAGTITAMLANAHQGTYPVTVEGGEAIIRQLLRECVLIQARISASAGRLGVKRAGDVEFFGTTSNQKGTRGELLELQRYWRGELCEALGIPNLREEARGGGQSLVNC